MAVLKPASLGILLGDTPFTKGLLEIYYKMFFAKDVTGLYLTPLIGYSKVKGQKSLWIGWLFWCWTFEF